MTGRTRTVIKFPSYKTMRKERMRTLKYRLFFTVLLIIVVFSSILYINQRLQSKEKWECENWQKMIVENPFYYTVAWQKYQCEHFGIILEK